MKKKDPRGRKSKTHKPVDASLNEVLGAIGSSEYKNEKKLKKKKNV